jgi:uncharacterized protein (DUF302 family)
VEPIGIETTISAGFDEVLGRLPDLLKAEGFGVLTRIDVKATLKEKLGLDFRRYQILGACNPKLAHQALGIDLGVGTMLPCNVVVREADDGRTVVTAVDPMQTLAGRDARFREVAGQVRERLARVVAALGTSP